MHEPVDGNVINSSAHCTRRIREAFKNIPDGSRAQCKQFFDLFLNSEEKVGTFATQCWTSFYQPYYRCGEEFQYPSACKYEVHVPLNQANVGAISYAVVQANAKTGRRIVAFWSFIPGPAALDAPLMESLRDVQRYAKKMTKLDDPFRIDLPANKLNALDELIATDGDKFEKLGGANANIRYQVIRHTDEPRIVFPCYNLALQCAHQIASEDIGMMIYDTADIWSYMAENNESEFKLLRKPPDKDVLLAFVFWQFFEVLKLPPTERMLWVLTTLRSKEAKGESKHADALYKRVTRYFESHLARAKQTKVNGGI